MDEKRVERAEEFLREAVYRSRASQAVSTLLAKSSSPERGNCGLGEKAAVALDLSPRARELFEELFATSGERVPKQSDNRTERSDNHTARSDEHPKRSDEHLARSNEHPERSDKHTERSEEHTAPRDARNQGAGEHDLARILACMREWIEAQDALDRKRNHFLKAFRNQHGFDRTKYSPAEIAELDAGLARVNAEEDRERRAAAEALLRS